MTPYCLNCNHTLAPRDHFCAACGQKADTHRISWHEIWHDALHYFTHADKGIFFVLKCLLLQPGMLVREYVDGKRKKYMSPVTLLLICAGITYLSMGMAKFDNLQMKGMTAPESITFASEEAKAAYTESYYRSQKLNQFILKNSKLLTIAAIPIVSFVCWLFLLKGKFNFTEHLVANSFITSFMVLVYSLVLIPIVYFTGNADTFLSGTFLFIMVEVVYRTWTYMKWHQYTKAGKWFFFLFMSIAASLLWSIVSAGIGALYIAGVLG